MIFMNNVTLVVDAFSCEWLLRSRARGATIAKQMNDVCVRSVHTRNV